MREHIFLFSACKNLVLQTNVFLTRVYFFRRLRVTKHTLSSRRETSSTWRRAPSRSPFWLSNTTVVKSLVWCVLCMWRVQTALRTIKALKLIREMRVNTQGINECVTKHTLSSRETWSTWRRAPSRRRARSRPPFWLSNTTVALRTIRAPKIAEKYT